jgi:hypothetical protein
VGIVAHIYGLSAQQAEKLTPAEVEYLLARAGSVLANEVSQNAQVKAAVTPQLQATIQSFERVGMPRAPMVAVPAGVQVLHTLPAGAIPAVGG